MTAIVYVIFSKVYRDIADENLRCVEKRFVLDEAHRYITDPAFSHWISLVARTGRHWNIMLDLITQSLADLDDPSQPWSKAIITNLKQAFFFAGQKDVEASFRKLQLTDYHIEQYKRLDPSSSRSSIGPPEDCGESSALLQILTPTGWRRPMPGNARSSA